MSYTQTPPLLLSFSRPVFCCLLFLVWAVPAGGTVTPAWRSSPHSSYVVKDTLRRGETLYGLLLHQGVEQKQAFAALRALKKHINPKHLLPGTLVELRLERRRAGKPAELAELRVPQRKSGLVTVRRKNDTEFTAERYAKESAPGRETAAKKQSPLRRTLLRKRSFTVGADFTLAAESNGVSAPVLRKARALLKKQLDPDKDIHAGATCSIVWAVRGNGRDELLALALKTREKSVKIFRYTDSTGTSAYYTPFGKRLTHRFTMLDVPNGKITSGFGMRIHPVYGGWRKHTGIDIRAAKGTPVRAAADGVVTRKGWGRGYGRIVALKHTNRLETRYAHLSRFAKKLRIGQKISKGEVIAYVGATGHVTGPHLHFEIRKNGIAVNPLKFNVRTAVWIAPEERGHFAVIRRKLEKKLALNERTTDGGDTATRATWEIAG